MNEIISQNAFDEKNNLSMFGKGLDFLVRKGQKEKKMDLNVKAKISWQRTSPQNLAAILIKKLSLSRFTCFLVTSSFIPFQSKENIRIKSFKRRNSFNAHETPINLEKKKKKEQQQVSHF